MQACQWHKGFVILLVVVTEYSASAQTESHREKVYASEAVVKNTKDNAIKPKQGLVVSDQSDNSIPGDRPVFPQPLTLEAALALAGKFNPGLQAKRRESGIADGELRQASIYFQHNPELSFGVGARVVTSPEQDKTFAEPQIELSQEFEIWGQPDARRKAAEAAREATLADILAAEWEILAQVRQRFYAAQVASRRVRLVENQSRFADTVLKLTQRQLEAGDISRTDYRQLEIQSARLKTNLLTARAELKSALSSLRISLGLSPAEKIEITDELAPPIGLPHASDVLIEEVLERHPRLHHARFVAKQRRYELTLEHIEVNPNVTGSFFWEQEENDSNKYGINLSFPLPLFNRRQGLIAAARSTFDMAEAEMRSVAHALRNETETAISRYAIGYEAASFYRNEVLPAIRANLEQLEKAFRLGEIGLIDLRVNQRELIDAQITALDTLSDYYEYRAKIEGLLGRGIEGSRPRTKTP
jgi:cobalt-zinc-cadmium efflux system outer membrane protein